MQQHLIVGLGSFGGSVIERVRALPVDRNVVYHRLDLQRPLRSDYLAVRQRMLDLLNREVYNFANVPLTVYLVGLLVEEHLADDALHLGYLWKTFFRENIILAPRIKFLTALPTILPEEAFAWLPETRRVLERIDALASLKEPFRPEYEGVKRKLPSISGPPFEDILFCTSESLDADDLEVTAQAAATKIYFDLRALPQRLQARPELSEFYRGFPSGQPFAPLTGTSVAFLPALPKLVRDEMEYALLVRLVEDFFPVTPPDSAAMDALVEDVLRQARALRPRDVVDALVEEVLTHERWFDLAALEVAARYDIEMSPPPDAFLAGALTTLDRERQRYASRVREAALERVVEVPDRILAAIRSRQPDLDLWEVDTVLTRAFHQASRLAEQAPALARQAKADWERLRGEVAGKGAKLKAIAEAKEAKLKHGSDTEARLRVELRAIDVKELLRRSLQATVAEALAEDATLEPRLREAYGRLHERLAGFLQRRGELLTHLRNRREAFVRRRELHLYVFNQVFRQRLLEEGLQKRIEELCRALPVEPPAAPGAAPAPGLGRIVASFFFKRWFREPGMALDEVERTLLEDVGREARREIEAAAAGLDVDYREVLRILEEIAVAQASSIFDVKYKEHPLAAYRQALYVLHRDELSENVAAGPAGTFKVDRIDVARMPDLPYQVLLVMEIYNLPFRALRQYASLDRSEE